MTSPSPRQALAARRAELRAEAAQQRAQWQAARTRLASSPMSLWPWADTAWRVWRMVREQPTLAAVALAVAGWRRVAAAPPRAAADAPMPPSAAD